MRKIDGTPAPTNAEEQQVEDVLERYRERRIREIRLRGPLDEERFVPVEKLRELADEYGGEEGAPRSG